MMSDNGLQVYVLVPMMTETEIVGLGIRSLEGLRRGSLAKVFDSLWSEMNFVREGLLFSDTEDFVFNLAFQN